MRYSEYIRRCATRKVKRDKIFSIWDQYDEVEKIMESHMNWLYKQSKR